MMSKRLKECVLFAAEVLVILGLLYTFTFPYKVDGESMANSYHTGDRVLISHFSAWTGRVKRGDVVVCDMGDMRVIKRVIAVPGDKLVISDGKVYLNDELLEEDYLADDTYTGGDVDTVLGEDEYFVMGDNRDVSLDSRMKGSIAAKAIKGRVFLRLFKG
jgi:signal peptidase I